MSGFRMVAVLATWVAVSGSSSVQADAWLPYERSGFAVAKVTAYCPGTCCCGPRASGVTSVGRDARLPGAAVAPDAIPYGSVLWIPGAGYQLADDTGGAMRTSWRRRREIHVDLRMSTHDQAREWGVRYLEIALYRRCAPPPPAHLSGRESEASPTRTFHPPAIAARRDPDEPLPVRDAS